MVLELKRKSFTIAQYHHMTEMGVLQQSDRVELIEGEILEMAAIGSKHAGQVLRLNDLLTERLGRQVLVNVQNPVELGPYSEPQPDITLLRRRADYYVNHHPLPTDVYLVIEVADSTIEYDREVKAPLYSRHGMVEYWLIDLNAQVILVHRNPTKQGYSTIMTLARGQTLEIQALPGAIFTVDEILGCA